MEMEVELEQSSSRYEFYFRLKVKICNVYRVEALQQEMTNNARNFAREISQLKIVISEKQAMLDNISYGY